jgi:hypothetical protein
MRTGRVVRPVTVIAPACLPPYWLCLGYDIRNADSTTRL